MSSYLFASFAYRYRQALRLAIVGALAILAASALWSGTIGHGSPPRPATAVLQPSPAIPTGRCEEDQPCWDCRTMGNHVCVETNPYGEVERIWYPSLTVGR